MASRMINKIAWEMERQKIQQDEKLEGKQEQIKRQWDRKREEKNTEQTTSREKKKPTQADARLCRSLN